jgi:hypothetical protein
MQTLGLAGEPKRSDGWLKSIFWPRVENAWDVDYLGSQGFWVCFFIALFTFGLALLSANPAVILLGLTGALIYWAGGMGVREKNWIAAAIIFFIYLLDCLYAFAATGLGGAIIVRLIVLAVLFSNIRATFLASEWKEPPEGADKPSRFHESFKDKLADVWPPRLWKILQIPFYALAAFWILLSLLSIVITLYKQFQVAPHS